MSKLLATISWLTQDIRGGIYKGSNRLSLVIRKKLERLPVKQLIGINLAGFAFFSAVILPQAGELASNLEVALATGETIVQVAPMDSYFQWPLSHFGLTTRFSLGHPGVDLTAPVGTPVFPIAGGVVSGTGNIAWGYGKHVLVKHERGVSSLYAHLNQIEVQTGQEVSKATLIGEIGATGWSTGYHLHLETYQDGVPVNPLEILPAISK